MSAIFYTELSAQIKHQFELAHDKRTTLLNLLRETLGDKTFNVRGEALKFRGVYLENDSYECMAVLAVVQDSTGSRVSVPVEDLLNAPEWTPQSSCLGEVELSGVITRAGGSRYPHPDYLVGGTSLLAQLRNWQAAHGDQLVEGTVHIESKSRCIKTTMELEPGVLSVDPAKGTGGIAGALDLVALCQEYLGGTMELSFLLEKKND